MENSEHKKSMTAAYQEALRRLRINNEKEFHSLLETVYAERGIEVKKRLTGSRKVAYELAKARALLDIHNQI